MMKHSLTDFEIKVLKATTKIPFGNTRSYKWIAKMIGRPKSSRAVGQALKRNPFPFIIPCHRVIRTDGSLGGYAKGVKLKRILINMEKQMYDAMKQKPSKRPGR